MRIASLTIVALIAILALQGILCLAPAAGAQNGTGALWATLGAHLEYTFNGNFNVNLKLSNGSSATLSGSGSGSLGLTVNSVSNGEASITSVPNLTFQESISNFDGKTQSQHYAGTPANSTTTQNYPLSQLDFEMVVDQTLGQVSSTYGFSPTTNASLTQNPGALYQWNGVSVPALHITLGLTQHVPIPNLPGGESASYSTTGSGDIYVSLDEGVPLEISGSVQGTGSASNVNMGNGQTQSVTGSGSGQLSIKLDSTNISLGSSNAQQATVQIPAYSASLVVLTNSTVTKTSTSGNELEIDVTGPSGTSGVMQVLVSQSLLSRAGVSGPSAVQLTLDGQAYENYTVGQVADSYIFTIYYHHSSHTILMSFGSANFGNNQGSISQFGMGGSTGASLPWLLIIIAVVAVVAVAIAGIAVLKFRRRPHGLDTTATSPTPPPPVS